MQKKRNSSVSAMELRLFSIKPSIYRYGIDLTGLEQMQLGTRKKNNITS